MKTIFTTLFSLFILAGILTAQTTYKITASETWGSSGNTSYPNPCFDCTFNLASNVVLTIEKDVTFSDVTINGGTIIINKKDLMLWSKGGKNKFNSTKLIFNGNQFTANGPILLDNSTFTFSGSSNFLSNNSLEMFSSKVTFNESSYLVGQGSKVSLTNSHLVAGDGLASSKAYIKMNGAKLVLEDKFSGVEVLNSSNYYFNWSDYTSASSNQSIKTTNNSKNCGGASANSCSAPVVYGPIALTPTGLGATLVLPVIIKDLFAIAGNGSVNISWSTKQESNSALFVIERSNDGSSWSRVGEVKAAGNSNNVLSYHFSDVFASGSVVHYRLKLIDLDNKFVYSDVKSVRLSSSASVRVYPNPSSDYATITLDSKSGNTKIRLINQNGQVMTEKSVPANSAALSLPLKQYQDGAYVLSIADQSGNQQTIRLIITHGK